MIHIDIIAPVYNEEDGISAFLEELEKIAVPLLRGPDGERDIQILLVNDGSTDKTLGNLTSRHYKMPVKVVSLSRNFGHQAAVWAGIESSRENAYVVVMDSDLQDPPKELVRIFAEFANGGEVVLMERRTRKDTIVKRGMARLFYRLQRALAGQSTFENVGDFFGLAPNAKKALLSHQESVKYLRGLVAQLGFDRKILQYDREERPVGRTHYTFPKMFALALSGLTGFSVSPLMWVVYAAFFGVLLGTSLIGYVFFLRIFSHKELAAGWASSTVASMTMSIITLLSLAIVALYLARVVQELKARPVYLTHKVEAFGPNSTHELDLNDEIQ
ncbi:MAG: glycosyltransferase family 2 protein [Actinobacteria bacterium]|nr:glycosyltransferase family 2 protein [Actinomycetota bacterium]